MDPKITLYEHRDFGGRSLTFTNSCSNFVNVGFNDTLSSVVVEGGVWVLFQHINYQGSIYVVCAGEKKNVLEWNDTASSIKLIDNDFTELPSCTLYTDWNFQGKSLDLHDDAKNLQWYNFNDRVSSIRVYSGGWIAYTDADFKGQQTLYLLGNHSMSASEGQFPNDMISSLKAIQIKPTGSVTIVKLAFDLTKAIITTKPSAVFEWTQINDSSVEQHLSIKEEKSITKENTYEFHWNQGARVSASVEVQTGIPFLAEGKISLSAEASYDVGSNSGTKTSKTEKWSVEFPSKIPARSKMVLSTVITEGKYDVPFTAVMKQGHKTWTEYGTFKGVSFYGFVTNFKEEKLQ